MQNRKDISLEDIQIDYSLDSILDRYAALLPGLRNRTKRVLNEWKESCIDHKQFFDQLLTADRLFLSRLPGNNVFTRIEIRNLRKTLLDDLELNLPVDLIDLPNEHLVIDETPKLTAADVDESNETIDKDRVVEELTEPSVEPTEVVESISDTISSDKDYYSEDVLHAVEIWKRLGYLPYFAAIDSYIERLKEPDRTIAKEGIRLYYGQEISSVDDLSYRLNLTHVSVRNRRYKILNNLESFFHGMGQAGVFNENPYKFQMNHVENDINTSENTHFCLPFIYWALGSTFQDLTLLGDATKCLTAIDNSRHALFLAPTALFEFFDFEGFISEMYSLLKVKRIDEERVNLRVLLSKHIIVQYCEDYLSDIELTCRTFLYINFLLDVDYGCIIFPANKKKTNIQIVEDIVKSAGQPLSLTEILNVTLFDYPEREWTENSIRGAIRLSGRIIATMPSGKYAWNDGQQVERKMISVCSCVDEYLQSLPERIATSTAVTEYVIGYIPDTNEEKIVYRLYSDQERNLCLFFKEGIRYIGYADGEYPDDFFSYPSDYRVALNYSIMFPKFVHFVQENHRYPFSRSEDEDEVKIRLFWIRTEKLYEKGELDTRTTRYFEKVSKEYSRYKMDKTEFLWRVQYAHIAKQLGMTLSEEIILLLRNEPSEDNGTWFKRNMSDYRYRIDRMPDWKKEYLDGIIKYFQSILELHPDLITKLKLNVQDNLG